MAKKKNKNISKNVPNGRLLHTSDKYFYGSKGFSKGKGLYRMAAVVDSNLNDELAIVKLTTSDKGKQLPNYQKGKSGYRNYIHTLDCDGNPIKLTPKDESYIRSGKPRFEEDKKRSKDLSLHDVNKIKIDCINDPKTGGSNRNKLKRLKGRKTKK